MGVCVGGPLEGWALAYWVVADLEDFGGVFGFGQGEGCGRRILNNSAQFPVSRPLAHKPPLPSPRITSKRPFEPLNFPVNLVKSENLLLTLLLRQSGRRIDIERVTVNLDQLPGTEALICLQGCLEVNGLLLQRLQRQRFWLSLGNPNLVQRSSVASSSRGGHIRVDSGLNRANWGLHLFLG